MLVAARTSRAGLTQHDNELTTVQMLTEWEPIICSKPCQLPKIRN
jgi:hypothetical protein